MDTETGSNKNNIEARYLCNRYCNAKRNWRSDPFLTPGGTIVVLRGHRLQLALVGMSHRITKATLTHGLSDQEGSNLDETDDEENPITADEYDAIQ